VAISSSTDPNAGGKKQDAKKAWKKPVVMHPTAKGGNAQHVRGGVGGGSTRASKPPLLKPRGGVKLAMC